MAEVRKFRPGGGQIAEAIAKAMGENARPATPGAPPAERPQERSAEASPLTATTYFANDQFLIPAPENREGGAADGEDA